MQRGHAEALAPMVRRVMRDAGLEFSALHAIAVTVGPGTFTGQRVGLAFARALAVALKVPVTGATTLDAMAEEALAAHGQASLAIVASDAKRGEIYLSAVASDGSPVIAPQLTTLTEAVAALTATGLRPGSFAVLAGTGAEIIMPLLAQSGIDAVDSAIRQPTARYVAAAAARRPWPNGSRPLYLRPPDARLPGGTR